MTDNLMEDMTDEEALEYDREERQFLADLDDEALEEYYEFRRQEAELADRKPMEEDE